MPPTSYRAGCHLPAQLRSLLGERHQLRGLAPQRGLLLPQVGRLRAHALQLHNPGAQGCNLRRGRRLALRALGRRVALGAQRAGLGGQRRVGGAQLDRLRAAALRLRRSVNA